MIPTYRELKPLLFLLIVLFAIAFLASACSIGPTKPVVPDVPIAVAQKTTIVIPMGLIAPCTPLTNLDETRAIPEGQTPDVVSVWSNEHTDCSIRFQKYVDLTGKALNINQVPVDAPASGAAVIQ